MQEYHWYCQYLCHFKSRKPEGVRYSEPLCRTWDGEKQVVGYKSQITPAPSELDCHPTGHCSLCFLRSRMGINTVRIVF